MEKKLSLIKEEMNVFGFSCLGKMLSDEEIGFFHSNLIENHRAIFLAGSPTAK